MELGELLFFGLTGLVVLIGAAAIKRILTAHRAVQQRGQVLGPVAARHGLSFTERTVDDDTTEPLLARTLFQATYGAPAYAMSGADEGVKLDVFESVFRRGGRTAHHRSQLVFVFSAAPGTWPRFIVQPEWAADEPKDTDDALADVQNVELELEDFDEEYTLAARSPDEGRRLLTPELRAALLLLVQEQVPVVIEGLGERLVVWREEETVDAARFEQLLLLARRVRKLFDAAKPGAALCAKCRAPLTPGARFCAACGSAA